MAGWIGDVFVAGDQDALKLPAISYQWGEHVWGGHIGGGDAAQPVLVLVEIGDSEFDIADDLGGSFGNARFDMIYRRHDSAAQKLPGNVFVVGCGWQCAGQGEDALGKLNESFLNVVYSGHFGSLAEERVAPDRQGRLVMFRGIVIRTYVLVKREKWQILGMGRGASTLGHMNVDSYGTSDSARILQKLDHLPRKTLNWAGRVEKTQFWHKSR
jgi:hypothetical protein